MHCLIVTVTLHVRHTIGQCPPLNTSCVAVGAKLMALSQVKEQHLDRYKCAHKCSESTWPLLSQSATERVDEHIIYCKNNVRSVRRRERPPESGDFKRSHYWLSVFE